MDKTDKTVTKTRAGAKRSTKKTMDKTSTDPRIAQMPPIVTKDTNNIDEIPIELSIDQSVFNDSDFEHLEANVPDVLSRSKTIDESLLSSDRMRGKKKKPVVKGANTDFHNAIRHNPDYTQGLSAAQVDDRIEKGYINATGKKTGRTYPSIIFSNLFTSINLLTFSVAIALIIFQAKFSQLFFIIIISLNIGIGIFQEIKSKRTVDKLSLITAPSAIVVRDGEKVAIPVREIVLDDIVYLESGKQICADGIVVRGEAEVNESMLTGESVPVKKTVGSELYSGSFVSSGSCYVRVDKVGAANYVEALTSHAKKYKKPKSELQGSVLLIIRVIIPITLIVATLTIWNYYSKFGGGWESWQENVKKAAGAIIGMIPAGMFLLTSTALYVSVMRLGKRNTLVQDLYCIEMLARVNVLCLDKTGTITDGTMQVKNVIEIKGGAESQYTFSEIVGSMLTATGDNNQTARALADYFGYSKKLTPTHIMPFSSQRKLSAVSFEGAGTYIFGAPEFVMRDVGTRIEKIIADNASGGYRVLVLAHSPSDIVGDKLPAVRRPLCLIVIEDHIREDAMETIKWFKENNVAVKVISGDNPITVSEVAKRVGVEKAELYVSLEKLSNQEVIEAADKYTVFGRVTPEQKMLLIKALKSKNNTVAMTGDGVNDILAMREADCSVAIASGAEAATNVAHLVLMDSNFTSMPEVVMEGRRVVNNIQKSSSLFLMKTLMSIILSIVFIILRKDYPFTTDNLLLLEMVVVAVPSFALALQKNTALIKGKFLSNVIGRCVPGGLTLVVTTMAIYFYNQGFLLEQVASNTYTTMLVLNLTFAGFIVLTKICEPFDAFRTVLVILVIILSLVGITALPDAFGITPDSLSLQDGFFLATVVLGSYFFTSIMMKIMKSIKVLH